MKSGNGSKSKSIGAAKAADTSADGDGDGDGGFNVVKAAKKLLKKLPPNSPAMELHDLARALQKQQQKKKRTKGSEEDETTLDHLLTPSQLRAALEAAGGKFEFGGDADGDGSAVIVRLRDGDRSGSSSSSKKRKNKGGGDDENVAKKDDDDDKKKKRQRSASSSEGRNKSSASAAATPGDSTSVAAWRKSHKVVVMVEPTPEGATPANPVVEQHLVPVQSFADLKGTVTEASWKIPLEALIRRLSKDFERPSPIQAQAWPVLLRRHNLVGIAETGR
jgi:hypothetical protein